MGLEGGKGVARRSGVLPEVVLQPSAPAATKGLPHSSGGCSILRVCDDLIGVQVKDVQGHPVSTRGPRHWTASRWIRVLLTLLGAAGLVTAAFYDWIQSIGAWGTNLPLWTLWNTNDPAEWAPGNAASVGVLALVLAAIALIGLLPRMWWLTSLAGVLAVAEATLFVVTAVRANGYEGLPRTMTVADIQAGVWTLLAGGVLLIIAGLLGPRRSRAPAPEGREPQMATT
jgi:hypothetical protein